MKHRMFQVIATGEWLEPVLSDEEFPDGAYTDRVGATFGFAAGAVRHVDIEDGAPDPRIGNLRKPPVVADEVVTEAKAEPLFKTALRGA